MGRVLACADVGSNTVHLLVAETDGKSVFRIENRSEWLGLGEKVARAGRLSEAEIRQLVSVLDGYSATAKALRAESFYVFATEAMRAAANHQQVLEAIHRQSGTRVHVIPPRTEAEYSYRGSLIDTGPFPQMTLFEVGGGSAQIGRIEEGRLVEEHSVALGTGRLAAMAELAQPCPPEALGRARRMIRKALYGLARREWPAPVVASGGVARGLWRALHPDGERSLHREEVRYLTWASASLTVEAAAKRFNCKLKRAATLLPGSLVYGELLTMAGAEAMTVSEYGIREGAILAIANGELKEWLN